MLYNFLCNSLGKVESAPILDTMLKEVVGINAPRVLLTRSKNERKDAFYSEAGNTIGFFGAGAALDQLLIRVLNPKTLKKQGALASRWGIIGRSAALFSTSFAILWAMPFVRNYLTARQTGSTQFTQVIGAHPTQPSTQALQASQMEYKRKALSILGLGLAGSVLAVGGARLAIARKWGRKTLNQWFKNPKGWIHQLTLKDGRFSNFSGLPALLFWGVPAYVGFIHASRDNYERKEQLLKFFNFTACFFGPSLALKKYYQKKLQALAGHKAELSYGYIHQKLRGRVQEQALKLWVAKSGLSLLSSIVLLSTMPQLINIYLTKRRLAKAQAQNFPMQSAFSQPFGYFPPTPNTMATATSPFIQPH
jgi:hypothetical protein